MRGDGLSCTVTAGKCRRFLRALSDLRDGPYSGAATAEAAALLAEAVRYLNYAGMRGGVAEPAEVSVMLAHLATAVYRLPQLLGLLGGWLSAEAVAGRLADDDGRPGWQRAESALAVLRGASEDAVALARCLGVAHSLTATFRAADPAAA
jgi:hypothetical protein